MMCVCLYVLQGGELTGSGLQRHTVQGVLFYYPYQKGKETRPAPGEKPLARRSLKRTASAATDMAENGSARGAAAAAAGASSSSSAASSSSGRSSTGRRSNGAASAGGATAAAAAGGGGGGAGTESNGAGSSVRRGAADDYIYEISDDDDEEEENVRQAFPVVSCYWQNRMMPLSSLQKLPFFPDAKSKSQCDNEKLPENWRGRLKGYLFFDWNFRHISNNKLRIQVDPNIDDWINAKERGKDIHFSPTTAKNQFLK